MENNKKRLLIAFDGQNTHLREILAIIHHGETGEVEYQSKPVKATGFMIAIMFLFKLVAKQEGVC